MKDPDKVLFPSGNLVLITLRVDESEDGFPFTLLDDISMDLGQGSAIKSPINASSSVRVAGPAHAVNSPIALRTGGLS